MVNNETLLANQLRQIYYDSVIEESFNDDSDLLNSIIALIENDLEKISQIQEQSAGMSHWLSNNHELVSAFLEIYHKCISKAEDFAYIINSKFGSTVDLSSVIAPFFLYKAGITDENISFYIALGLVVAKIICDSLADKKDQQLKDKQIEENIKAEENINKICNEMQKSLIRSKKYAPKNEIEQINKSIKEFEKIKNLNKK